MRDVDLERKWMQEYREINVVFNWHPPYQKEILQLYAMIAIFFTPTMILGLVVPYLSMIIYLLFITLISVLALILFAGIFPCLYYIMSNRIMIKHHFRHRNIDYNIINICKFLLNIYTPDRKLFKEIGL